MLWYEMILHVICACRFGGGSRFENGKKSIKSHPEKEVVNLCQGNFRVP